MVETVDVAGLPAAASVWRVQPPGRPPLHLFIALALVRESATSGSPEEERRALERLAVELRRARSPALAGDASRLAWSQPVPAGIDRAVPATAHLHVYADDWRVPPVAGERAA